jgi:hypothetical protein
MHFPVIHSEFYNTIIWGERYSSSSAIQIDNNEIPYLFKNCLLSYKETNDSRFVDCLFQLDPLFQKTDPVNRENNRFHPVFDFRLQKDSPAKDVANLEIASQVPYDLNGFYRLTDGYPDIGAYEYYDDN